MSANNNTGRVRALRVQVSHAHGIGRIVGNVVTAEADGDEQRNPSFDSSYLFAEYKSTAKHCLADEDLDDFEVSCYLPKHDNYGTTALEEAYGFSAEYRSVHSADLARAKSMVKTLTYIERKNAEITDAEGYCTTFGQYLSRICRIIGCTRIALMNTDANAMYNTGREYRWLSTGDAIHAINNLPEMKLDLATV